MVDTNLGLVFLHRPTACCIKACPVPYKAWRRGSVQLWSDIALADSTEREPSNRAAVDGHACSRLVNRSSQSDVASSCARETVVVLYGSK